MSYQTIGLARFVLFSAFLAVCVLPATAVQPQRVADEPPRRVGEPRSREDGRPGRESAGRPRVLGQQEGRQQAGTEEGMPAVQPRVTPELDRFRPSRRWRLGVYAYNTSTGVVITGVVPRTPAQQAGLERGDVIVTVNGYQVGYVNDWVYYLGDELQRQAQDDGRVRLLVQNRRNARLINLDVRLSRRVPARMDTRERIDKELGTPGPTEDRRRDTDTPQSSR